jgi:hypothetical protein
MPANAAAVLEPVGEARAALESVPVKARLRGLVAENEVTQTCRNLEAVDTFPLPLEAVLLEPADRLGLIAFAPRPRLGPAGNETFSVPPGRCNDPL